ncbi:MAG: RluA family pseudouridine synthase [Kiloniellales bacterium]
MSGVRNLIVAGDEAALRLDRWFRRHFPGLGHGRLEKLLRTGQVRVDGKRAKAGLRLVAGQTIRVPPIEDLARKPARPTPLRLGRRQRAELRHRVLHMDDDVIAFDKPPGLAVQGGSGVVRHLDAMLEALSFDRPERPRLVHRLDKDTSGVLLLARSAAAAAWLGAAFRKGTARKVYWAIVVGVPRPRRGRIDLSLSKRPGKRGEKVTPGGPGFAEASAGKRAVTLYATVDVAGRRAAWLGLMPLTGRGHQLRVHCAALGTPILGDGKYGGAGAFLAGEGIARRLHLHARSIALPHPRGGLLRVTAPLPPHMQRSWQRLGFEPGAWDGFDALFDAEGSID